MFVMDARRRVRDLWGPYSPKIFDGTWLEQHEFELIKKFPKEVIIADNHFSWGRDHQAPGWPKFYANYPEPKTNRDGGTTTVLTAEKKQYNAAIRHARARVESPFGLMKQTWKIIAEPFKGDHDLHKNILTFIVDLHNAKI